MNSIPCTDIVVLVCRRWGDRLLGTDAARRLRVRRSLATAGLYLGYMLLLQIDVILGMATHAAAKGMAVFVLTGAAVFYGLIRSGWSQRWADPALTLPQMLFAVVALMIGYAIVPLLRSGLLVMLAPVMVFGMFSLTPRQVHGLTAATLAIFLVGMLGLAAARPESHPLAQELINFAIMAVVLPVTSVLAGQLYRLRSRLREQRTALNDALSRLEQLIRHDPLTGLANRRAMRESLAAALQRTQADASPLCVCMIDLDHFKRINDLHGHAAGDEALARYALLARATMRGGDVLGRWGGEEFLLLLPATDLAQAALAMQRMRAALADSAAWRDLPHLQLTFSAGVACWQPGETVAQLVARADAAAYQSKAEGRDRCTLAVQAPGAAR